MSQVQYFKHVTGTVCHRYNTLNMSQLQYFKRVTGTIL